MASVYGSSQGSYTSTGTESSYTDDQVILHKVARTDTIAGLALKYNVTIADIKNANGLFTDSAMYTKDLIVIPPKPAHPGDRYLGWWDKSLPTSHCLSPSPLPVLPVMDFDLWRYDYDDIARNNYSGLYSTNSQLLEPAEVELQLIPQTELDTCN